MEASRIGSPASDAGSVECGFSEPLPWAELVCSSVAGTGTASPARSAEKPTGRAAGGAVCRQGLGPGRRAPWRPLARCSFARPPRRGALTPPPLTTAASFDTSLSVSSPWQPRKFPLVLQRNLVRKMFVAGGLKNTCSLAWVRNPPPKKRKKSPKPHIFPSAGVVAGDLQAAAPPAGAAGGRLCPLSAVETPGRGPEWSPGFSPGVCPQCGLVPRFPHL